MNKSFIEKYPFAISGIYAKKDYCNDNYEYEEDEDDDQDNWVSLWLRRYNMTSKVVNENLEDMMHSIHYILRTLERIETVLISINEKLIKKEGS